VFKRQFFVVCKTVRLTLLAAMNQIHACLNIAQLNWSYQATVEVAYRPVDR